MNDQEDDLLPRIVALLLIAPFDILCYSLSLKILWGWFMVPIGLAPIGKAHAFGISVVASLLLANKADKVVPSDISVVGRMATSMTVSLVCLGIGWLAHSFM